MLASANNSTTRFSDRVKNYTRYRPSYPQEALNYIVSGLQLKSDSVIADVGSGTGLLTQSLLPFGSAVIAVEPNDAMRAESDSRLSVNKNYHSIAGQAESTTLENQSVDLITAAQAFHWFDVEATAKEFIRILKPQGHVVLVWNRRLNTATGFQQAYENMLVSSVPEYSKVTHANASDDVVEKFLGPDVVKWQCPHHQHFDLPGVRGRLESSSYCPSPEHEGYPELMAQLTNLFDEFACNNAVTFTYTTEVYKARW